VLVKSAPLRLVILTAIVSVLALVDGALHVTLDVILFRGNFFGPLGPPPGAPPPSGARPGPPVPFPLPLNQMFVLNLVGYLIMIALLWLAMRRFPAWRRWVDVAFIVYVVVVFLSWVNFGAPNPQGLGYLSKSVEILTVAALLLHLWLMSRIRPVEGT
jgi:heme A synthase